MSSPMYQARAKVKKIEGVHRTAEIATGVCFEMGVHALERHAAKCPTAVSLGGAVSVTWEADIEETP
jgi:hypothetical protein